MEVLTASVGFCLGITRAYREMNKRALAEAPFAVAHANAGGEFDTLTRIERREQALLAQYPGLRQLSVVRDVSTLESGDRLVLGFHGLSKEMKESLVGRGVDLLDDLICPFIEKLDRVVERLAKEGFDIAIVGAKDNHHCRVAKKIAHDYRRRCYVLERADDVDALRTKRAGALHWWVRLPAIPKFSPKSSTGFADPRRRSRSSRLCAATPTHARKRRSS
jgi:4-hydroxy-3-methylbut-2-enyl diphosphate reductase